MTSRSTTTTIVMAAVCVLVAVGVGGWVILNRDGNSNSSSAVGASPAAGLLVRPDSHRLGPAGGGKVTFVEFLDFECEACRSYFPLVEKLRADYSGRVTFVIRYFPIPSHTNAERAARAVEAAARQGQLEPMYKRMYATQAQWGEQRVPQDNVFRGFASDLGLDLARFDTVYNDPATLTRIRADIADGNELGVEGTPTFFVNGARLQPRKFEDFTHALDSALNSQ